MKLKILALTLISINFATSCLPDVNVKNTRESKESSSNNDSERNPSSTDNNPSPPGSGTPSPPTPVPTPTSRLSGIIAEGDTLAVSQEGNHTNLFSAANPNIKFQNLAENNSTLDDLIARKQSIISKNPKVVTVMVGTYDLEDLGTSIEDYASKLFNYTDSLRAIGTKVAISTVLPRNGKAQHNSLRLKLNHLIRWNVGKHHDEVIDYAAHPYLGGDADAYYNFDDGLYPNNNGQRMMFEMYRNAVMDLYEPKTYPLDTDFSVANINTNYPEIPSDFTTSDWLHDSAIPGSAAPDVLGAFRFICQPSHLAYDDPIVFPGQPGKSHLHMFFGNTKAHASSTYRSLRESGQSTCQGGPLNRSAYWIPAMMNGRGKVAMPEHISIYYKAVPGTARLPRGLRMVFGHNFDNPGDPLYDQKRNWKCTGGPGGTFNTIAAVTCPKDKLIGVTLATPPCWDGKNLDSPDHRSHMANKLRDPHTGKPYCPTTHLIELPVFTLGTFWKHDGHSDYSQWFLASDTGGHNSSDEETMGNTPGGSTMHADWFGAWDDSIMKEWADNCTDKLLNCSGGNLGSGRHMERYSYFNFSLPEEQRLVDPPPMPVGHHHHH